MSVSRRRSGLIAKTRVDHVTVDPAVAAIDAELDAITLQIAADEDRGVYKAGTWDRRRACLARRRAAIELAGSLRKFHD